MAAPGPLLVVKATRRFCYDHPRPAVTVDVVLFRRRDEESLEVLLIERGRPPYRGAWALPGGFVDTMEDLEDAARRELREETGLAAGDLIQVGAYGTPGRDPRGHTISVAYTGFAEASTGEPRGGDDATTARFFPLETRPPLAFDHDVILEDAAARLVGD